MIATSYIWPMFDEIMPVVRIRYNTESNGTDLCWRLLINDKEHLVQKVHIHAPCLTSKDWLEDKQQFKHHISVTHCRVVIDDDLVVTITSAE